MADLQRCTKCLTPETHETIVFNNDGVCNICEQQQVKSTQINWELNLLIKNK